MARRTFYYGWTNLGVAALAMVATLPGRTQGLGLVTEPLIADLGIDRVSYANVNLWATLLGAALCLPVRAASRSLRLAGRPHDGRRRPWRDGAVHEHGAAGSPRSSSR